MEGERNKNHQAAAEILLSGIEPEEAESAAQLIELLAESGVLITVRRKPDKSIVTITRERNVAEDSDTFIQRQEQPETDTLGYMLPFKDGDKIGFVLIDTDFTSSVHFIKEENRENYKVYNENLAPGGTLTAQEPGRLHTGGLFISFEDIGKRLTPNNPEHADEIDRILEVALKQAEERARETFKALQENRTNTVKTLDKFLRNIRGERREGTIPNNEV